MKQLTTSQHTVQDLSLSVSFISDSRSKHVLNIEYFRNLDLAKLTKKIQRIIRNIKNNLSIKGYFHQWPAVSYRGNPYGTTKVYKITLNYIFDHLPIV